MVELKPAQKPDGAPVRATRLTEHTDFEFLGISGSEEADGEAVFVGYAIEKGPAPDYAMYSSFREGDHLNGKIAVLLRYEPLTETGDSPFSVRAWSAEASGHKEI